MAAGQELISNIAELTGLPKESVKNELIQIVKKAKLDPNKLTLDQIRFILADYLQETLVSAKRELETNFKD